MDLNRVNTDGILKQTLERVTALPNEEKETIIKVVDAYCMAWGFQQQFASQNKTPFGFRLYRDPVRGVIDDTPEPEVLETEEARGRQ